MNYLPRPDAVLLNGSENTAQTQNQSQGHRRKNKNLESLTKYISMQGKNHTFAPYVTQIRQYDIRNAILLWLCHRCNKIPKPQFIKPFPLPVAELPEAEAGGEGARCPGKQVCFTSLVTPPSVSAFIQTVLEQEKNEKTAKII